jgi:hypothetical protein
LLVVVVIHEVLVSESGDGSGNVTDMRVSDTTVS